MPKGRKQWRLILSAGAGWPQDGRVAWRAPELEARLRERLEAGVRVVPGAPPDESPAAPENRYYALETDAARTPQQIMEAVIETLNAPRSPLLGDLQIHAMLWDDDWRQVATADARPPPRRPS